MSEICSDRVFRLLAFFASIAHFFVSGFLFFRSQYSQMYNVQQFKLYDLRVAVMEVCDCWRELFVKGLEHDVKER
ncbi:hypothetical protein SASPL_131741 [Salvia splendens]|uniref:Uncharacterized protein n=1 Tax=Salvia splendens TaxID=180675 RepID=A0A8X8X6F7_SALSN|nr:hypothetical protein SASPL_131741 [Salvia splendens]